MGASIPVRLAIERSDAGFFVRVKEIRELEELKRQLHRELERLSQSLLRSGARTPDDLVQVAGTLEHPADPGNCCLESVDRQRLQERKWRRVREMAQEMPPCARNAVHLHLCELGLYRQAEVQARVEHLSHRLAAINSASAAMLTSLRQVLVRPKVA